MTSWDRSASHGLGTDRLTNTAGASHKAIEYEKENKSNHRIKTVAGDTRKRKKR